MKSSYTMNKDIIKAMNKMNQCSPIPNEYFLYKTTSSLTDEALKVLEKYKFDKIVSINESYMNDGYGSDGPKSYIYNLILIFTDGIVHRWHREEWFDQRSDKLYHLYDIS